MGQAAVNGLQDGVLLAADRDAPQQVPFSQAGQRPEERSPTLVPGGEQVSPRVFRTDDELGVAVAPGLVSVSRQEVRPARLEVPGQVLDDDRDTVGVLAWSMEELLVGQLAERLLGPLLLLAEAENHVREVCLPE